MKRLLTVSVIVALMRATPLGTAARVLCTYI